jgi:hypothetical protein
MRTALLALLVPGLLLEASRARAEPSDPAAAEMLFRQGRSLVRAQDYRDACPKFAESLRLEHAPGTLLNLADCEEHVGRTATAWAHFKELSKELPWSDERQPLATARAAGLEQRLARLTIRASALLGEDRRVLRDEVELGPASLNVALPVDPGKHTVLVRDRERVIYLAAVEVHEGQTREVGPESFHVAADRGVGMRTAGWTMGGVAVAALVTSAAFGGAAIVNDNAAAAACAEGACRPSSASDYAHAHTQVEVAGAALGVSLAAAVAAGSLFLLAPRPSDSAAGVSPPPEKAVPLLGRILLGRVTW